MVSIEVILASHNFVELFFVRPLQQLHLLHIAKVVLYFILREGLQVNLPPGESGCLFPSDFGLAARQICLSRLKLVPSGPNCLSQDIAWWGKQVWNIGCLEPNITGSPEASQE